MFSAEREDVQALRRVQDGTPCRGALACSGDVSI